MKYNEYYVKNEKVRFLQICAQDIEELNGHGMYSEESIALELDALNCIQYFPKIRNLALLPGEIKKEDIKYLENVPVKNLLLYYYSDEEDEYCLDLALFPELEYVFSKTDCNFYNPAACRGLKALSVVEWNSKDLSKLVNSALNALTVVSGRLRSMNGIEKIKGLRFFSVSYQRGLADIAGLQHCQKLECLEFDHCPKIKPEELPELAELRYLKIIGNNRTGSIVFLKRYPQLEYCILDIFLDDGSIDSLTELKHSVVMTDRRNFTKKNAELPKATECCNVYYLSKKYSLNHV